MKNKNINWHNSCKTYCQMELKMRKQNTLKSQVEFNVIGLHSGHNCRIIVKPAPEDTGIVFINKSSETSQFIPYHPDYVTDTMNNITVSNGKAIVKTVEHLTAALYSLKIDNCLIETNSTEIPIMDGSARVFVEEFLKTGLVEQKKDREEFRIINPIWVTLEDKYLVALPYDGLKLSYTISFPGSPVGTQAFQSDFDSEFFINNIADARTFGFIEDVEHYKKNGLIRGVNYDNVQVFSRKENKALNTSRYQDEPVRHKLLDLVGGLAILNFDIKGFIISYKGGHTLDVMFARKVRNSLFGSRQLQKGQAYPMDTNYYRYVMDSLDLNELPS
jgi:UDP-3-O-[3-hydroxymyristoyl] N-acetylglucosamine deacetylase